MKLSTLIFLACAGAFVFSPNTNGHRLWDDIRAVGLDLGSACTLRLPLGE